MRVLAAMCTKCEINDSIYARGLCKACYRRQKREKNNFICMACNKYKRCYSRGMCRSCYEKQLRANNPEFAERQRQNRRDWGRQNVDKVTVAAKQRTENPHSRMVDKRTKWLGQLRIRGITEDQYAELCSQGCAICGSLKNLHIDHDHETGLFRGILCSRCNNGLGFFDDNIEGLEKALAYLNTHKARNNLE